MMERRKIIISESEGSTIDSQGNGGDNTGGGMKVTMIFQTPTVGRI